MRRLIFILFVVLFASVGFAKKADPIMQAMQDELNREHSNLVLKGYKRPYFISYYLRDVKKYFVLGAYGAIFSADKDHSRNFFIDCRVGSYQLDSSLASSNYDFSDFEDKLYIPSRIAPLDDNAYALKRALWLRTDYEYKKALKAYLKVKGRLVTQAKQKEIPAFSKENPVVVDEEIPKFSVDMKRYKQIVRKVGALLIDYPEIFDSGVAMSASRVIRYIVNTEGTKVRTADMYFGIIVNLVARAVDGMRLSDTVVMYYRRPDQAPTLKKIIKKVKKEADILVKLTKAPVIDPATVPAILMPGAAGVFFHETLGHRLEGQRQRKQDEGKTFRNYIGKQIMPTFLDVYDDPTMAEFNGVPLNGYYRVDDQGVKAQRVVLVKNGVLKNFLMSRTPVKGFNHSNGHGRSNGRFAPVARMGNLIVKANKSVPMKRLYNMLLDEIRRQHKPFGVIIERVQGGSTNTSTYGYQAFKDTPIVMYKVDAKTGKKTLVRGVEIVGTPLVSLSNIIAAGNEYGVFNGYCGAESGMVPVSAVAPALLFKEIELQRTSQPKNRGQIIPPPEIKK